MNIPYFYSVLKARMKFGRSAIAGPYPSRIKGKVRVTNNGTMHIGRSVLVFGTTVPSSIYVFDGGELSIGDNVFFNFGLDIGCTTKISIGSHSSIGPFVTIIDSHFHSVGYGDPVECKPIAIGDNVWLSRGVTVLPGVTIGNNAVIGVGSVVTKDIPPNTLAAGAPAKPIRQLKAPPDGWVRTHFP